MVTILCRTYNKIEFVRQSLERVAMQKTRNTVLRRSAKVHFLCNGLGTSLSQKEISSKILNQRNI